MKKVAWILSVVLCVSLLIVCFAGCAPKGDEANSFVALDINPSVEMVVDSNDKVVSVYGSNEDGQVLLYGMVAKTWSTSLHKSPVRRRNSTICLTAKPYM